MGKIAQLPGGGITITYGGLECPFSGIDATHQSGIYINPDSLAAAGGLICQDGYLNSVFLNPQAQLAFTSTTPPVYVVGDVQTNSVNNAAPYVITKYSYGFVAYSQNNLLTIEEFRNGFADSANRFSVSIAANNATNLSWYCINGVVYITGLGLGAIYAYTPIPLGTSTLTLLTNYVGGAYLSELNGRLLVACCDQITGGIYTYYPFRISWSAALGAYSQFNPLVGGLVTGAGFEDLPDVADEIIGVFNTGPTGYIIRKQGITEMSPLNSGIQPFDFNHMWASKKGIGSVYPNTVTQYGSLGSFLSDIGIFTIGYGGINQIQGLFWAEINRALDNLFQQNAAYTQVLTLPVAALVPLYISNERKLVYALYMPTPDGLLFLGDVNTQAWNSVSCFNNIGFSGASIQGISSKAFNISAISSSIGYSDQTIPCITSISPSLITPNVWLLTFYSLDDTLITPPNFQPAPFTDSSPYAVFPVEEVGIFKDVTVDTIVIVGDADVVTNDAITITPSIASSDGTNITYTPVRLTGQGQFAVSYPTTKPFSSATGQFTTRFPQLTTSVIMGILGSSSLRIYKVVMFCSVDSKQRP